MIKDPKSDERSYNILVYGIDAVELTLPSEIQQADSYTITHEPYHTTRRFDEFDAVILYKGIFEDFTNKVTFGHSELVHKYDRDELDKRKKESLLLLKKGGLLCFLLADKFIDRTDYNQVPSTDLAKYHLFHEDFHRTNYGQRVAHLDITSDDFRSFLEIHGAAWTHYLNHNDRIELKTLAKVDGDPVAIVINRNQYFIPTLIPNNNSTAITEYFMSLATALISSNNKLQSDIPEWIKEFSFEKEATLIAERQLAVKTIDTINAEIAQLNKYKSILMLSSDTLVSAVNGVFKDGFSINTDSTDELREDLKLLNDAGEPICLCELKGTNKGVKREYINQADSHRERSGFPDDFPSILIVNTHIKKARSIAEKDQEIANEQVLHAVKMNILIVRTIDLLQLLRIFLNGTMKKSDVIDLLTCNNGWIRFEGDKYTIVKGAGQ